MYAVTHQAGNARLARPDSNRGTPLRGRVLYPTELRATGGLGRIRTGVAPGRTPLCRRLPIHSVTRPQCPRPDSNGRPAPSEGAALSSCTTRTCVPVPGADPGLPKATALQAAERAAAHNRLGRTTSLEPANYQIHSLAPRPLWIRPQSIRQDSNLRSTGCGPAALATELLIVTCAPRRTRTSISGFVTRCPSPLNDGRLVSAAGDDPAASSVSSWRSAN